MVTVDANAWIATFDPTDPFHAPSTAFFRRAAWRGLLLHGPTFVVIEVACALARRLRDPASGADAAAQIRAHPLIRLHPLNGLLLGHALQLGTRHLLRGADTLYAATAQLSGTPLVSWDNELIRRAGAVSPTDWLNTDPGS